MGPGLFALAYILPLPGLAPEARGVLGLTFWMATWWVAEVLPIYATALLPVVIFPLIGAPSLQRSSLNYADDVVFLFLGGFLVARAVERVRLDQRFALYVLRLFGPRPRRIVAGFMLATASMSAWISNTATTLLMLPIAMVIITTVDDAADRRRFGSCLLLGIAYSASLGGLATLIGTPPNALFASLARNLLDMEISFGRWMLLGLPISLVSLLVVWAYLVHVGLPIGQVRVSSDGDIVAAQLAARGSLNRDELLVAIVFAVTALGWLTRGLLWKDLLPMVSDATIALSAGLVLFLLPAQGGGRLLDWQTAAGLPWGVLLLMGGGLALASGFTSTGLDVWIADQLLFLSGLPFYLQILVIVTVTVFASEIMSNTATAALLIPIAASLATAIGTPPILLTLPVALATSYGFAMPVGTPPNAIIFASNQVSVGTMARVGLPLDFIGIAIVTIATLLFAPLVWG
jgi:solute carrier family 13 (sodium-dependent dicarboxylate transporter), member 2/3/5